MEFKDLFLVGTEFYKAGKSYGFKRFENVEELIAYFEKNKIKNGNLLIKGSRGIQLEKILDRLS